MDKKPIDLLIQELEKVKNNLTPHDAKKLDVDLIERMIIRLNSFSPDCEACRQLFLEMERELERLNAKQGLMEKVDLKQHDQMKNKIISHLQKEHKLVTKGLYLSIYMSLGMSIGLVFGMLIFDNLALGLPIGMVLGMAIGSGLDADAKKKGLTI